MEDSQLTRLAIEEIVRQMGERKQQKDERHERKLNPLGKPNKRFLGRTLSSVLTHNKRNNDRTQANCRRKLEELDDQLRRGVSSNNIDVEGSDKEVRTQRAGTSSEFVDKMVSRSTAAIRSPSSESASSEEVKRPRMRKKSKKHKKEGKGKKKRKIKKSRKRDKSEIQNRSRSQSRSRSKRALRTQKPKTISKVHGEEFDEHAMADDMNYYEAVLDGYIGTTVFDNATLHSVYTQQVRQLLCYQAMLANMEERAASAAALAADVDEAIKIEFEDQRSERMSSASSSLSISSDLLEGEEIQNGVLTIYLTSDEFASDSSASSKRRRKPSVQDSCSSIVAFDLRSNSSILSHESVPEARDSTVCICLDSDSKDSANNDGNDKSGEYGICLDSESEVSVDDEVVESVVSASNAPILADSSPQAGKNAQEAHTVIDLTDE